MTGFLIWTRGSNLRNASGSACQSIFGSSRPPPTRFVAAAAPAGVSRSPESPSVRTWVEFERCAISVQSFSERPERQRGEVRQADEDDDHADEHAGEQRRVCFQRADGRGHLLLPPKRPG